MIPSPPSPSLRNVTETGGRGQVCVHVGKYGCRCMQMRLDEVGRGEGSVVKKGGSVQEDAGRRRQPLHDGGAGGGAPCDQTVSGGIMVSACSCPRCSARRRCVVTRVRSGIALEWAHLPFSRTQGFSRRVDGNSPGPAVRPVQAVSQKREGTGTATCPGQKEGNETEQGREGRALRERGPQGASLGICSTGTQSLYLIDNLSPLLILLPPGSWLCRLCLYANLNPLACWPPRLFSEASVSSPSAHRRKSERECQHNRQH